MNKIAIKYPQYPDPNMLPEYHIGGLDQAEAASWSRELVKQVGNVLPSVSHTTEYYTQLSHEELWNYLFSQTDLSDEDFDKKLKEIIEAKGWRMSMYFGMIRFHSPGVTYIVPGRHLLKYGPIPLKSLRKYFLFSGDDRSHKKIRIVRAASYESDMAMEDLSHPSDEFITLGHMRFE